MPAATRSFRRLIHAVLSAVVILLALTATGEARIAGEIVSVGFQARGAAAGSGRVVRLGGWTPIVVELTLEGLSAFNGRLRVAQRDRDGDVCYDYQEVVGLSADTRPIQKYTLYTLPTVGPDGEVDIRVELLNDEDERIEMVSQGRLSPFILPPERPVVLDDDQDLILEISPRQMGKIARLADPDQRVRPLHPINVAHVKPNDVPDRWLGLEAVDAIVWDEADPDALNPAQRSALAEWTLQGGLLLVATARHAAALQKSEVFKGLLPVQVGPLTTLQEAARFRNRWLGLPLDDTAYAEPVTLAQSSLLPIPGVRRVFPAPGEGGLSPQTDTLIARRQVGRGAVVFVAASLRDLLDADCDAPAFFRAALEIRTMDRDELYPERTLYEPLESTIGFARIGSGYLVFAMLFVMAYVGLSTFGSWGFLKARGWSKHNWTAFALCAAAAAVVSITAAQSIRGVGRKLHQLTIVDATAGERQARALAYFGLKTGTHSVLDVWLAENHARDPEPRLSECFLRPLAMRHVAGESRLSFADPGTYNLGPATAELWRVPVRATLKQFEGRWRGDLLGRLDASIRIVKRAFEKSAKDSNAVVEPCFDPGSTITNRLGVDLEGCLLFQPTSNRYPLGATVIGSRATGPHKIIVHALGDLRDGETVNLASRLYLDENGIPRTWEEWHHALLDWHNRWAGDFARSVPGATLRAKESAIKTVRQETYQEALLLATTLSEYDEYNSGVTGFDQLPVMFSRQRCRSLDLSGLLTDDMVLLVGFARDPGPVSLCTRAGPDGDYKRLTPKEAWTVYRIIIPIDNLRR